MLRRKEKEEKVIKEVGVEKVIEVEGMRGGEELKEIGGGGGRKGVYNVGEVGLGKDGKEMREVLF
ncbi:hypothetical protein [Priestia megaterium]|uniref:hypothetical protein n=1 Tax=Priestia megaterium TaxID=1404 RepID=UPI0012B90925|nr:hypothetical protein [Priestia megaterium]